MKLSLLRGLMKVLSNVSLSLATISVIVICPGPIYQPKKPFGL